FDSRSLAQGGSAKKKTRAQTAKPAAAAAATPRTGGPNVAPYTVAGIPAGRRKPDDLFDAAREPEIASVVDAVLAAEAPIRMQLLARRVGAYCGIGRVTARVSDRDRCRNTRRR